MEIMELWNPMGGRSEEQRKANVRTCSFLRARPSMGRDKGQKGYEADDTRGGVETKRRQRSRKRVRPCGA